MMRCCSCGRMHVPGDPCCDIAEREEIIAFVASGTPSREPPEPAKPYRMQLRACVECHAEREYPWADPTDPDSMCACGGWTVAVIGGKDED